MFKLVKINGARTNVPEPTTFAVKTTENYLAGCIYYVNNDCVSVSPSSDVDLKFIPLETVKIGSGKKRICGYIVNEDMVFETNIYNDHTNAKVGNALLAYADDNGQLVGVDSETGYDALLLSKDEAKSGKKVLVALKW